MSEVTNTLPAVRGGYELTRFNALRHGVLSRYTVLPWEDADEYHSLVEALVVEHAPQGPTEVHLVEELAGILWRKRRLRLAEAAAHRRGLEAAMLDPYRKTVRAALVHVGAEEQDEKAAEAIRATAADTAELLAHLDTVEEMTRRAIDLIGSTRNDAYEAALDALHEDTRDWWKDTLGDGAEEPNQGEEAYNADAAGLLRFLEEEVLPWYPVRRQELANRPLIQEQVYGEALDPDKLERLGRYEVHLDRKLERTLSMLIKVKDLRQGRVEG
jgi:hypothetical protein